jgi:hypothetical protein
MHIEQIMIEAERPDDVESMFRLSINANLIAKGVTAAQAHYLAGEVLGRWFLPQEGLRPRRQRDKGRGRFSAT